MEAINTESEFELKKRHYFSSLALQTKETLKLHKAEGLWERKEGKRDWGNVSEHCLVEAARAEIFADLLGFSPEIRKKLKAAAALHDFFQKRKRKIVEEGGLNRASFARATEEAVVAMQKEGVSDNAIRLVNSVSDEALFDVQEILNKKELSENDKAFLVMHYLDDYTIESGWVKPAEVKDGNLVNDLDRRVDKNEANPRYQKLNEEGRAIFGGETVYQAQRRIGHLVERRLAELIKEKSGKTIEPVRLPEIVDQELREKIEAVNAQ